MLFLLGDDPVLRWTCLGSSAAPPRRRGPRLRPLAATPGGDLGHRPFLPGSPCEEQWFKFDFHLPPLPPGELAHLLFTQSLWSTAFYIWFKLLGEWSSWAFCSEFMDLSPVVDVILVLHLRTLAPSWTYCDNLDSAFTQPSWSTSIVK